MPGSALAAGPVDDTLWLRVADAIDRPILFRWQTEAYRAYIETLWGWDEGWQQRDFERLFVALTPRVVMHHTEDGSRAVGYIQTQRRSQALHLANIVLRPGSRGQGIGSRLLRHMQTQAAQARCAVTLKVFRCNERARVFYQRLGFVETSRNRTHFVLRWAPIGIDESL